MTNSDEDIDEHVEKAVDDILTEREVREHTNIPCVTEWVSFCIEIALPWFKLKLVLSNYKNLDIRNIKILDATLYYFNFKLHYSSTKTAQINVQLLSALLSTQILLFTRSNTKKNAFF